MYKMMSLLLVTQVLNVYCIPLKIESSILRLKLVYPFDDVENNGMIVATFFDKDMKGL